jgi:hypothetical protein
MWEGGGKLSFYLSLCGLEYQIVIYMYIIQSIQCIQSGLPCYRDTWGAREPWSSPGQQKGTMNCR